MQEFLKNPKYEHADRIYIEGLKDQNSGVILHERVLATVFSNTQLIKESLYRVSSDASK